MYRYPDFPDHVYVELTNICNARCTICATPAMKRKRAIMSEELFQRIADECGRRKARKFLPYLHGESLLVPGVTDYFRYMRKASPETHINLTTNGSKLSPEITEELLEDDLVDSLIVSIDGATKETFEKIRINLKWDQVRSNVLNFIRRRDEMGKSDPKVSIAMVTVEENKSERELFREVWKEADEVRYSVYFNWGGKLDNNGRTPHKVNFCERLYHYITILADGRVALCCFDSEADYAVGDVTENSIYRVWHSEEMNARRRQLYQRDFEKLKICGDCDYLNHPKWAAPLVRIRPYMHRTLPGLTGAAERAYKNWLMR
ncbi:MAG TPA: radical SAM protein [Acidobacteriota bacterium]|nr:radical SAM protein [Acidobacteriota bacterium]